MELNKIIPRLELFSKNAETDLKSIIVQKGHKGSGKLLDSIKVSVRQVGDNFNMSIEANEYIKFLDNGNLLKDFKIELTKKLKVVLKEEVSKLVKEDIYNKLKALK